MNIILLSGGSGKRLWPLSNDIRSKQFLKFFKDENGQKESMLQHVYSGIKNADKDAKIVIATSKKQVSSIHNQIGKDVMLSVEPERRDTFPAIILAALYMHDILCINENEPVVVCPVDPYVEDEYFEKLKEMSDVAKENDGLTLLGIEPSYPSEKYGYIIPEDDERISRVNEFVEKPDAKTAEKLIGNNALWNAGIFAFKMGYAIDKAKEITGVGEYVELFDKYESLEKISFDYAVAEHEKNIHVIRYDGTWMDLGTWNTFAEAIDDETIGNVVTDDECNNTNVINDLDIPILCMGLKDMIVAASADGILISDKEHSSYIKPYVDRFEDRIMYADKSWGSYEVRDADDESLTIKVTLKKNNKMNYHSHENRDEIWVVISGRGRTVVDGLEQHIEQGDVITMQAGCKHTIIADEDLRLIEVQIGRHIDASDKIKFDLDE